MQDTNISILQYIRSGEVSVEHEIENINAGKDINIHIRKFISNSPDYQKLQQKINEAHKLWNESTDADEQRNLAVKLTNLKKLEKEFTSDILRLANIFSNLDARTQRLRDACYLFDQGRFSDADKLLDEADLGNDQFNLFINADYLELKLNNYRKQYKKLVENDNSN